MAPCKLLRSGLLAALALAGACKSDGYNGSELKTNLGVLGNELATQAFTSYKAKPPGQHCLAAGAGKHVIVTGFGLFANASYNISGVVVESMMDPAFWSGVVENRKSKPVASDVNPNAQPADGLLEDGNFGGRVTNRAIQVDGKTYQVCFIIVDVKWDVAGAIIAYEMSLHKPDMVIMSGRGSKAKGLFLEGGAINNAVMGSGFAGDGHELGYENQPADATAWVDAPILEGKPSGDPEAVDKVKMTWDNTMLGSVMSDIVKPLHWSVTAVSDARSDNDYICNNVSYIALNAAKGEALKLAGEEIQIKLAAPLAMAKVGFMHYPIDAQKDAKTVRLMATGVASLIGAQLP